MSNAPLLDEESLANLASDLGDDFVILVLARSIGELAERAIVLEQAKEMQDGLALKKVAHSISGIAATIGALQLRDAAKDVELNFRNSWDSADQDQLSSFNSLIAKSAERLKIQHALLSAKAGAAE